MGEKKDDNWEMPQPVFKSSEGSLPKSLEETISTSFMANAETIEIDEDDDILGIMDASFDRPMQKVADLSTENILELVPETEPATVSENKTFNESTADIPVDNINPEPTPKPITVTAKSEDENTHATSAGSGLFTYVLLLLAAVILAAFYFFFVQNK